MTVRVHHAPSPFETALAAIYRSALDRSAWQDSLVAVSDYVGATGGLLVFNDFGDKAQARSWCVAARLRGDLSELYAAHYADNLYTRAISQRPASVLYAASEVVDAAAVRRTGFHADILAPQRIADQLALPYAPWARGSSTGGVSFAFDARGAADLRRRRQRFERVAPHLLRALDLGAAAEANDAARQSLFALADTSALPAMLIDAAGTLAHANPAAEALLREGDGLRAGGRNAADARRLQASRPGETQRLAVAIGRAVSAASDPEGAGETGGTFSVRIGRPSGRPDLAVCVVPLPVRAAAWPNPASICAALFVLQPARGGCTADARAAAELGGLYGLTRAEQRVAALVGGGLGLPEAARRLDISPETARTHLYRCFDKTGLRSQVELARLLAQFPGGAGR